MKLIVFFLTTIMALIALPSIASAQTSLEPKIPICSEDEADILRLYVAFFGREHDVSGATYWRNQYRDGLSLNDIAFWMSQGPEFQKKYSSANTNVDFVERVYRNILNRDGELSGRTYWTSQMNTGLSRSLTVRWMAQSPELENKYNYRINSTCPRPVSVTPIQTAVNAGSTNTEGNGSSTNTQAVFYQNCTDVWNRLGRSISPSDPGFQSKFDRDSDGVGCETRPR